ncbi:glycoside hydrolase family 16 protein [Sorangium sp. So ce269]
MMPPGRRTASTPGDPGDRSAAAGYRDLLRLFLQQQTAATQGTTLALVSTSDSSFLSWWSLRSWAGGPGVDGGQWLPSNISFINDPANASNKLMRLKGTTDGTAAGSSQAEVMSTSEKFGLGTYAAKVKFYNTPLSGTRFFADKLIETFFTIAEYVDGDPDYSEQDFEYMPNGGWGQGNTSTIVAAGRNGKTLARVKPGGDGARRAFLGRETPACLVAGPARRAPLSQSGLPMTASSTGRCLSLHVAAGLIAIL